MAPRISLALAIHNHQPVGNFGWVFADVYERAYLPMLEALERHPGVRLSLHYTGPLLEWLAAERPEFLDRLGALVSGGQVELLGGGLYEPVLASLPEQDRVDQLTSMATALERITGRRPQGAWLAERVWEPDLPTALVKAGYRWTILDDQHFRAAAIPEANLWGAYTTEDQGSLLTVFGTEQGLRYRIPFGGVEDVIEYLRGHATEDGRRVGMMGDDGEKFGAWPTTHEHCWGEGRWVDRFFDAIEANGDWLATVTPSDWLDREAPIGRVYLPTSSYAEMGEWALPPDEAVVYREVLHDAVAGHEPQARWLRGGFWRNFQVRYREINDLHKQMLRASAKVAAMPEGPARTAARDHLHRGQSNDCYWHGLFGGIYISHLRLATHAHLVAAEDAADAILGWPRSAVMRDLDMDGRPEAILEERGQVLTVKPTEGGGVASWDIRAARHALAAVLRRRPEAYHDILRAAADEDLVDAAGRRGRHRDLDPRDRRGPRAGPRRPAPLRRPRAPLRAGPLPPAATRHPTRWPWRRTPSSAISATASSRSATSNRVRSRLTRDGTAAGQPFTVTRTTRLGGGRLDPGAGHGAAGRASGKRARWRRGSASSCRSTSSVAAAIRPRGTTWPAAGPPTTARARPRRSPGSGTATTGSASRSPPPRHRRRTSGGAPSRRSPTRSRGSRGSTRGARCWSRGRSRSSRARRAGSRSARP